MLAFALAALFWKELFAGQVLFFRDAFNQSYPLAHFIHDVCRQGHIPYWNPLLNFGQPLVANPNSLFFYPDTLLIVLLPFAFAYNFHYILSFMIAAAGTYWLARRWNQSRWAALFAASAFAFSGPLLSLGSFYNEAACAAWIPWALVAADKAAKERSARPWILLSVVFAFQFLAGELFTLMGTFVLALAYALYRAGNRRRLLGAENIRVFGGFLAAGIAALALAAVQFVPAAYLLAGSRRGIQGLTYHDTAYWSLHPLSLLETVLPHFFGNALDGYATWSWVLNGRNLPYFPSIFLGFVPLFFAFAGCMLGRAGNEKAARRFVMGAAMAFLIFVLGSYTPVFALVYLAFPPLGLVRFPIKLLVIFALLVALLAGWGVDAFRDEGTRWAQARSKMVATLGGLLAVTVTVFACAFAATELIRWPAERLLVSTNRLFIHGDAALKLAPAEVHSSLSFLLLMIKLHFPGLAGLLLGALVWVIIMAENPARGRNALALIAVLGIVQLAVVNYSANPTVPKAFYTYLPPVLKQLPPRYPPYRIAYIERRRAAGQSGPSAQAFLDFSSIPFVAQLPMLAQAAFRDRLVLARGTMLTGREIIRNSDVDSSIPLDLFDFWVYERDQSPDAGRADCLFGRTNVKYEILQRPRNHPNLLQVARVFNGSAQPDYLYENLCAAPRAYISQSAIFLRKPRNILDRLSDPGFDVRDHVIVSDASSAVMPSTPSSTPEKPAGTVEIVEQQPGSITLKAEAFRPAFLVLLDHYNAGWRAADNGRRIPILRANLLFEAVKLSAGAHVIQFRYRPPGFIAGLLISLVTIALLALAWVAHPLSG
ncbi:MAG: YfhO family protein [Terriglobia bacterium]